MKVNNKKIAVAIGVGAFVFAVYSIVDCVAQEVEDQQKVLTQEQLTDRVDDLNRGLKKAHGHIQESESVLQQITTLLKPGGPVHLIFLNHETRLRALEKKCGVKKEKVSSNSKNQTEI